MEPLKKRKGFFVYNLSTIIIRIDLCNTELRLVEIYPYTAKSLNKLQGASKDVYNYE